MNLSKITLTFLLLAAAFGCPLIAQNTKANQSYNAKDLETLLDPIFAERMEKLHIPGAVVSVVKDGKVIFSKGYGIADVEKKTPVVADKTLFRIGSITKVFTATAVMQMADKGKIKGKQNEKINFSDCHNFIWLLAASSYANHEQSNEYF